MDEHMGIGDGLSLLFLPVALAAMLLMLVLVPVLVPGDFHIH